MIECFELSHISKSPGVFDKDKLVWMNGQHLRAMPVDELIPLVAPLLKKAMPDDKRLDDPVIMHKLVELIQVKMTLLTDAPEVAKTFFEASEPENDEARAMIETEKSKKLFEALAAEFEKCDWVREGYNASIKAASKIAEVKGKDLYMPIRVKITGSCHGPSFIVFWFACFEESLSYFRCVS